jgi:hypothetical protein
MDSYDNYTSDEAAYSTLVLVFLASFGIVLVVAVISWVLIAIPLSALFRKTGIEPWKAWVPFYSTYTWLRLGGQNGNWVWLALIPYGGTVTGIINYIGMHRTGKAFGKENGFLVLGIFLPWVWLFILGYGHDEYRPELITAAGLPGPLEGYGARVPADGITVPVQYGATPYPAQPYPAQPYPAQPPAPTAYPAQPPAPPAQPPAEPAQPPAAQEFPPPVGPPVLPAAPDEPTPPTADR